jgi:hypothetical protein
MRTAEKMFNNEDLSNDSRGLRTREHPRGVPFAGSMQCSPDGSIMLPFSGERAVEESFRFSMVLKCVELRQNCQQFHQLKEIV